MDRSDSIEAEYRARTSRSAQIYERARRWLPGGDTRTINHYSPYPVVLESGSGCHVVDVDGNRYLDLLNNYSALIHGHAHPAVVAAVERRARLGTVLGGPSLVQQNHARMLCERVPSIDKVRYTNSGTEATLFALRAARAFTGRSAVVKVDGGYHGTHDLAQVNLFAGAAGVPQPALPTGFPHVNLSHGVPEAILDTVFVVPYNDLGAAEYVVRQHADRVAAVIVEPMLAAGGGIRGDLHYLSGLRELTEHHGVLLVFDEVATFRCGPLQSVLGIRPDLTALGKIIGGGFPIGAFGGREDIMEMFDPSTNDPIYHSGTFCGNDVSLAAGLAAMDHYQADAVRRLNAMGEDLLTRLSDAARDTGIKGTATGYGSYGHFHWGEGPLRNAGDVQRRHHDLGKLPELFHLDLLNQGVFISRRSLFCLSTPMTARDIDIFVDAFANTLRRLRPYIECELPHLLITSDAVSGSR